MKIRIFYWSVVSALAGFLFGFDTVVISGAEQKIQALWNLNAAIHGVVTASALYGTVLGALFGSWPIDRFGRKRVLLFIGVLYVVSAIGCALAPEVWCFIIARFIGGLGIGISTVVAPMYISEIAPPKYRGWLAGMYQFNIVFGIIIAFVSNYFIASVLQGVGDNGWRWMLGIAVVPSVIYTVLCFGIPESPRWLLVKKADLAAGLAALKLIDPEATAPEIRAKADEIMATSALTASSAGFWTGNLKKPLLLAFFIAFFNQMSGINAILYFAPRIFELTGLKEQAAMLQSVGIGVTNLLFTFVGLALIDRAGRRKLLYVGSFGYIISLGLVAYGFFTQHYAIIPYCLFAFIASHAVGQGTVIWVYLSEIFPNRHRAQGQSFGCSVHWCFAAALVSIFPALVTKFAPGYVFVFFSGMMVLQLIWVATMMVETKGQSLEQVQKRLGVE